MGGGQCALQVRRVHPSLGCVARSTAHGGSGSIPQSGWLAGWQEVLLAQEVLEPPHSLQGGGSGREPGDGGGVVEVAEEEEVSITPSSWGMVGARVCRTPTPWCRVSGARVVILFLPPPPGAGGAGGVGAGTGVGGEGGPTGAAGEGGVVRKVL